MSKIIGKYYHIYNRGAHKVPIFNDRDDYERFLHLMYISNNQGIIKYANLNFYNVYKIERGNRLVEIVAYCLMPNHYHIAICEVVEGGITRFIHRLCTSYSMYFNYKYRHSGTIFQGPYKHKLVDDDNYLRYLIQYIHLNPFGIENPDVIKTAKKEYMNEAIKSSRKYKYSSFKDYLGENRDQRAIIDIKLGKA